MAGVRDGAAEDEHDGPAAVVHRGLQAGDGDGVRDPPRRLARLLEQLVVGEQPEDAAVGGLSSRDMSNSSEGIFELLKALVESERKRRPSSAPSGIFDFRVGRVGRRRGGTSFSSTSRLPGTRTTITLPGPSSTAAAETG